METTQSKVIYWAKDKGLINQSNITRQALKLTEEAKTKPFT